MAIEGKTRKKVASIGDKLEEDKGIIQLNKVILVEGQDDVIFFHALLKKLEVYDIEIHEIGGRSQFKDNFPSFRINRGFEKIEHLAVIRDADTSADNEFDSIKYVLEQEGMDVPSERNRFTDGRPKIGVFIMPGDSDEGMLEDLCLKTVEDKRAMECVRTFIRCASELDEPPKNKAKACCQAFLAAMPNIVCSVGLGALKGYWDFDSDQLAILKSFVE